MSYRDEQLQLAVDKQTNFTYEKSKAGLVDYYQDAYGEKKWTRAIAEKLYGSVKNKKGENVSVPNIMRQFQGNRLAKDNPAYKGAFEKLGRTLPPISRTPVNSTLTFQIKGTQHSPNGRSRDRSFTVTIKGSAAQSFVDNPSFRDLWDAYGVNPDLFEGDGEDGDYYLEVGSVS